MKIVIKDGAVTGFKDELESLGTDTLQGITKRVSRIVPKSIPLRILFYLLRGVFSDSSYIASQTRTWPCTWIVIIDGKHLKEFSCRQQAIHYEKSLINPADHIQSFK